MMRIKRLKRGDGLMRPVFPNRGLEVEYRKKLVKAIDGMHDSVVYWLRAAYRQNEPRIAMDSPADELQKAVRRMKRQWLEDFDDLSEYMARWFARSVSKRSDSAMAAALRRGGFSVKFTMTPAMKDIVDATVNQNVSLIRSISTKYLDDVEGMVMRSVQTGRDLAQLTTDLQKNYGVTRRRAELIARDQNNKATSALTRARQLEVGVKQAIWMHSGAGKEPRPTHVKMNGKRYDVAKGMYDPAEKRYVFPGELINCVPASTEIEIADHIEVAYRRFYSGEMTELVTDSGKTLRATPNHPVLTVCGWKSIGLLNESDYVVEVTDEVVNSVMPKHDIDDGVALIGDIFASLRKASGSKSGISLGAKFHGDVADGDVDVVLAARPLSIGLQATCLENFEEFGLSVSFEAVSGISFISQLFWRCARATSRFVCVLGKGLSLSIRCLGHSDRHCGASVSYGAADAFYPGLDHVSDVASVLADGKDTRPVIVKRLKLARVRKVERSRFSGHVFNLQTSGGWYVAQGIVTHNCRCTSRAVVPGFD